MLVAIEGMIDAIILINAILSPDAASEIFDCEIALPSIIARIHQVSPFTGKCLVAFSILFYYSLVYCCF